MRRIETKHHPLAAAARTAAAAIAAIARRTAATACLATLCLLAACTADNDPGPGNDPGATGTPLVITADVAAPTPATRANTAAGQWTAGDRVAVEADGNVKAYLAATTGATTTLRPADAENTHFPPANGKDLSLRAWRYGDPDLYPWNQAPASWSVSFTQSDGIGESGYQRSDFLYAPAKTLSNSPASDGKIGLTFYHQTARVEVRIRKAGAVNDNATIASVRLGMNLSFDGEMYNTATFDASLIDPAAGQYSGLTADRTKKPSNVTMRRIPGTPPDGYAGRYEALVIPQDMGGKHFIYVQTQDADGKQEYYYYIPPAGEANLRGGYTYTYDITVSEHGSLHVTAADPIAGWTDGGEAGSGTAYNVRIDPANPPTINDDRVYLLTGAADRVTLNITGGNPTLIVRDLSLTRSCIHITGGTPEIRVEGTANTIDSEDMPPIWLDGAAANVRITGNGTAGIRLEVPAKPGLMPLHAVIGSQGTNGVEDRACGNIEISNLTLIAKQTADGFGAAIGTGGGGGNRKCGDITITNARIDATPGYGAASIGFGCALRGTDMTGIKYEMGRITLKGSTLQSLITREPNNGVCPAHIGGGSVAAGQYTVKDIYITPPEGMTATEFFKDFGKIYGEANLDDEVIVGFPEGATPADWTQWMVRWRDALAPLTWINWGIVPSLR